MVDRGNGAPLLLDNSASNQFQSIKYQIKNSDTVVILSDFDGTLSPIVDVPSEAEILDAISLTLRQLQRSPECYLGIVSGRSVEDLPSRVPVQNIALAGNYGIEIKMGGESHIHHPSAEKETAIQKAVREIQREISRIDGVKIENKLYTATIHYRNAQEDDKYKDIRQVVATIAENYSEISVRCAKKAYEIWPQTKWSKADAVERLLEKWDLAEKRLQIVYFGDDRSDEPVFTEINPRGISVYVGTNPGETNACYYVKSPSDVPNVLTCIGANISY